jgi:hypothetical protein
MPKARRDFLTDGNRPKGDETKELRMASPGHLRKWIKLARGVCFEYRVDEP